ncbi:hypothetical protein IL306_004433 [Fusarium sp. DS 682]|nr:hypothetical protein IL306_004433 [Fusarium sp. DS 682]
MRTTRAAKRSPNGQPLKGCSIVVTKEALERLVQSLIAVYGGSYRDNVDENTTHVVSSRPNSSEKIQIRKAQGNGPHIVEPDWLLEIFSDKNKRAEIMEGKRVKFEVELPQPNSRVRERAPKFNTDEKPKVGEDDKKDLKNTLEIYSPYIPNDSELAYKATLKKSNYVYGIEVVKHSGVSHFKTLTNFGRNGKIWVSGSLGDGSFDDAVNKFLNKFKDKTGLAWENRNHKAIPEKYAFVKGSDKNGSDGDKKDGNGRNPTQELMQLIFNEKGFSEAKIALGYKDDQRDLRRDDIEQGFKNLAKAAALIRKHGQNGTKTRINKSYDNKSYEILPGQGRIEIQDLALWKRLAKQLQEECANFRHGKNSKALSDRRLLWHGSRAVNYCSILSHGLRIPPPEGPLDRFMFAKGIDLTDISSVAARDCNTSSDALLLLCEAALTEENCAPGNTGPSKWIDAGEVHESLKGVKMPHPRLRPETNVPNADVRYNKYTCYDPAQVKLRYLLRFDARISGQ